MSELAHNTHLEFAIDQGETIIFDEATLLEQRNIALLIRDSATTHVTGQYDLDGRLHVTNNIAQMKSKRLAEVRGELAELSGKIN